MDSPTELETLFAHLAPASRQIEALVAELIEKEKQYGGDERRAVQRYPLACPVIAVPIDDAWEAGEAFAAITRDISARGISVYHTHPVYHPYLAIQWTTTAGDQFRVLIEVVRCRPVGPFFYEIAGTFVTQPQES